MFSLAVIVNAEGVTMDRDGNIYLVDDNDAASQPRLLVLSAVPLPGAAWLLGSGLIGFATWVRRKLGTDCHRNAALERVV